MYAALKLLANIQIEEETHVEYVLKAALVAVKFGRCSFNSQGLTPVFRIGSAFGALSTKYDIHACQPGSSCALCLFQS